MTRQDECFLEALKAALENGQVSWAEPVDWPGLFRTAEKHHVLPLVYEAVYRCPAAAQANPQLMALARRKTVQAVTVQTLKTDAFRGLYAHLSAAGLRPLVVKGLVCRSLYPNPDHRISSDEDLLIPPAQFDACRASLAEFGMQAAEAGAEAYEIPFTKPGSPLYIELHRSLFPPESQAYGDLNGFFTQVFDRAVPLDTDGLVLMTMAPTDHLFYLICHAFKHFLHSGFGLRQVCDIILFANRYGREIDWEQVLADCRAIRAEKFAAALFRMGQSHLTFDPGAACWPGSWQEISVDYLPMLADLLDAGLYGDGTRNRKHSSTITLNAVAARKQGRAAGSGVWQALFPPADSLQGRYPYLKDKPWLLPVAWGSRIVKYGRETRNTADSDAAGAIQVGRERLALLQQYGIIE